MSLKYLAFGLLIVVSLISLAPAADGNRLAYLDAPCDPYYPGLGTARLITPQWIGQQGVQAVIVLSIDDLREPAKHEGFLRPIHQRLKQIDGRAPVSLMANRVDPKHPQLQKWLAEGASLEAHTFDHPCPLLQGGDLAVAKRTFDRSVDLMRTIADNRPVAYRMPCCDSMSSVSPRFFTEIFGRTTPAGNFLALDSSVFMAYTSDDPALPRKLVLDADGGEKFRKYVPADRIMANLIENYPYPYVVDHLCWEIPTLMPSDWDAQHRNGVCSPRTVADLKAAVDATVVKQGIFALCFHPHGWIRSDQIIEVIDHAVSKYGKKIKFLTFRDVHDRLRKNFLGGHPLRAANGRDNGVRVLDLDRDGYMDVVIGNPQARQTRRWLPGSGTWQCGDFPGPIANPDAPYRNQAGNARFGVLGGNGYASVLLLEGLRLYHFDGTTWQENKQRPSLDPNAPPHYAFARRRTVRLLDVDGDGICEGILNIDSPNFQFSWVTRWRPDQQRFDLLKGLRLPAGTTLVDERGYDAGLRFVDVDEDGRLDVVFSNAERYSVHRFTSMEEGWSRCVFSGKRGAEDRRELPSFVRADGTNNGAWFKDRDLWVQNEDTGGKLPGHVFRRHLTEIVDGDQEP